jgi:hypothetical protein
MRKTFPLRIEGRHPDRVLDAVKHEIRKYLKRERRRELPPGMDYWDFDCRLGADKDGAQPVHVAGLIERLDETVAAGATQIYAEVLARAAQRAPRAPGQAAPEVDEAASDPRD